MSRAAAARGCSRYVTAAAIVRAEDSTVPTGSSSALLSWYGCHKQGRLQLVLRKYSFFVFFFLRSFVRFVGPLWLMPLKRYLGRL